MISSELLESYGATEKRFGKNDMIFFQGESALNYFQVISGEVKMNNYSEEGKEFIHGYILSARCR